MVYLIGFGEGFTEFCILYLCIFGLEKENKASINSHSGAPNDQFVVKCIIIPQLMKINVINAFQVFFSVTGKTLSVPFSQQDTQEIGWFTSQLIKSISQPGIPRAFKSLDPKRPNKSDKTGTKQVFSASAITLTSRRMFVTTLWEREGVVFFFFF